MLIMKSYLLFIFLCYSAICNAQKLAGSYRYLHQDGSGSRIITFSDGYFNEKVQGDLNTAIGAGIYSIKNNQLLLKYQEVQNRDTSKYELSTSHLSGSTSNIRLKVSDEKGIPMAVTYGCRDTNNNLLNLVFTDAKGLGNIIVSNSKSIGYFTIECIGYHRILIPIKRLMNKSVVINAEMFPETNSYVFPQTVQYKIISITNDKLMLADKTDKIIFEKVK